MARYVGRVGALAVALGIGAAIGNGCGLAVADGTDGSSSTSDASTSTGSANTSGSGSPESSPADDSDTQGPGDDSSGAGGDGAEVSDGAEGSDCADDGGLSDEDLADDSELGEPAAAGGDGQVDSQDAPDDPGAGSADGESQGEPETGAADVDQDEASALRSEREDTADEGPAVAGSESALEVDLADAAVVIDDIPVLATQVTMQTAAEPDSLRLNSVEQTGDSIAGQPAITSQTGLVGELLAGVTSLLTVNTNAAEGPVAPPASPVELGLLAWIRRQIEYSFFYSSPTSNYNQTANGHSYYGVVTGDINPSQIDGDVLSLSVTDGPDKGTVILNQDGSFAYAPDRDFAVYGGTDTFTVLIDTREGNPFHINLLKLFTPGAGATTTKVIEVDVLPTSPLGTADQIEAERVAELIVASSEVQQAIQQAKQVWLAGTEQVFGAGNIGAANLAQLDGALEEFARASALSVQAQDPNNPVVLQNLLPTHTWYGQTVGGSRLVYDNPDTLYRFIPVDSASTYVIEGWFVDGHRPADTNFSVSTGLGTAADLSGRDLVVEPDGSFTITVSAEPAAPGEVNHIQLPADAVYVLARNTLGDWSNEVPMYLSVTRTSGPPADTTDPTLKELIASTVGRMTATTSIQQFFLRQLTIDPLTGELREPNTLTEPFSSGGLTLATQLQSWGYFDLEDDEAIVVTIDPRRAGYFVVPVTNVWTITDNYWDQQTSLNNYQAVANPDGTYTFVISPTDPGVANWVSTGQLNQGTLYLRFQNLDPTSTDDPTVSSQFVTLDQLASVLPATTEYIAAEDRADYVAAGRVGFFGRFAPFLQDTLQG